MGDCPGVVRRPSGGRSVGAAGCPPPGWCQAAQRPAGAARPIHIERLVDVDCEVAGVAADEAPERRMSRPSVVFHKMTKLSRTHPDRLAFEK